MQYGSIGNMVHSGVDQVIMGKIMGLDGEGTGYWVLGTGCWVLGDRRNVKIP